MRSSTITVTAHSRTLRKAPVSMIRTVITAWCCLGGFNNIGRPDIYIANDSTAKFLYKNLGNGKFADIGLESGTAVSEDGSEQASMAIAIGDYLHTGRPSLYVTNFSDENDLLYRNDGNWNFTDVSYASGVGPAFLAVRQMGHCFRRLG